jgi:glycine cleavage system transcriptional repressor
MEKRDQLILTAIGPDHVGLVAKISEFISRHGCNIEDSKMAVFCGEFAIIILISGDAARLARVGRHYHEIEKQTGLSVAVKTPVPRKPEDLFLSYTLTASCMDHPGVVYRISDILSSLGINIDSMETKAYSAPVSGTPLFQLEARLSVPDRISINQLRERFAEFQTQENIDIDLTAVKASY